jgi:hypothetical protein
MYDISMRHNADWGIEGYEVPRAYVDSRLLAEIKENKQKKKAPRALKKGDYLTDTVRLAKSLPGPNQYEIVKPWFPEDKKKPAPKNVGTKNSYIDLIVKEQKLRPIPGPGAYNTRKSEKLIEEELKALRQKSKNSKYNFAEI